MEINNRTAGMGLYLFRLRVITWAIFAGLLILLARLAWLQVFQAERYREQASRSVLRVRRLESPRGDILDRNGIVLATSRPGFDLSLDLTYFALTSSPSRSWSQFRRAIARKEPESWFTQFMTEVRSSSIWLKSTSRKLSVPNDLLESRLKEIESEGLRQAHKRPAREWREIFLGIIRKPHPIIRRVEPETAFLVESRREEFPGIVVSVSERREYPFGPLAGNVIGFMSKVTPEEFERYRERYAGSEAKKFLMDDWTGRKGIEFSYNSTLRGNRGMAVETVDASGRLREKLSEVTAVPGADVRLTIDLRIQQAAEEALGEWRGAIVVLDPRNGEILALATSPRYDPGSIAQMHTELSRQDGNPLLDRATQGLYPPGSVFKVVTATAALEEGKVTPATQFNCEGALRLGDTIFKCVAVHGDCDLRRGMEKSCNVYFFNLGMSAGAGPLTEWARRFGFGKRSNIDVPFEAGGTVPNPARGAWSKGQTLNLSIGQGQLMVTPLQIARMMAAIASGGNLFRPHLLKRDGDDYLEGTLPINPAHLSALQDALLAVVETGTGSRYGRLENVHVAGKTGTAEVGEGRRDHGWFAGFAPFEEPRLAFAVVIEELPPGIYGGSSAAPAGRLVLKQIFERGFLPE